MKIGEYLQKTIEEFHGSQSIRYIERWTVFGVLTGIAGGAGAIIFYLLLNLVTSATISQYIPLSGGEASIFHFNVSIPRYILPLITALGGLISGVIVFSLAPEAEGHGTDQVIDSFHRGRGIIRGRVPIIKTIASAITIGTGGSAGREGPIAQIGAGFGSLMGRLFSLSERERRILVICGASAGIGAIFKAPLGGAIFGIEVLYKRDFEFEALVPAFISSIVAYTVFSAFFGWQVKHVFIIPDLYISSPLEINFFAILGILSGFLAIFYVKVFYGMRRFFNQLGIPLWVKPAIGGFAVGLIGIYFPQVLGVGYGWVQKAIYGELLISTMAIVVFLKIISTALTVSSGGSGGVFAPSLVAGAMLGGWFGFSMMMLFPTLISTPSAYVLVGMAAFFSGAAKVPISSIIMVTEMTGGYELLPPLMLASAISYVISGGYSIYEKQVNSRLDSPVHRREMTIDILEQVYVKDAMNVDVVTVTPETPVSEVLDMVTKTGHIGYPVVRDGELVGIITFEDVEKIPFEERKNVTVEELMTTNIVTAFPDETLEEALKKLVSFSIGRLPVVSRDNPKKLIGILTKSDIIRAHAKISLEQD